jgi:hypothetical protein
MRLDRSIRTSAGFAVAASLLVICSAGSSATPAGVSRNAQPAYHSATQSAGQRPLTSSNPCPQVQQYYPLPNTEETIALPSYCGATGSAKVPGVLNDSTSNARTLSLCESIDPITASSGSGNCAEQPTQYPSGSSQCTEASNTFLYSTLIILGPGPSQPSQEDALFAKGKVKLIITSPVLAKGGALYGAPVGVCVVADGVIVQDDFASGNVAVPRKDGTVHLDLILPFKDKGHPTVYPFPDDLDASVFFQYEITP